jgi:TPR repeat protein
MASHDVARIICQALGRGVTRSKRRAVQWTRTAAENGLADACVKLAQNMYLNLPYACEVGHVAEAAGVALSVGISEGHDVPAAVLTSVMHWLRKGGDVRGLSLEVFRREALEGAKYCSNDGCDVVGLLKDFKVCPQCKYAPYCGDACQKEDWNAGGHKGKCGTSAARTMYDEIDERDLIGSVSVPSSIE